MIVPFLKKNEKYSLYSTDLDHNLDGELSFLCEDKTNYSQMNLSEFDFINPFKEGFAIAIKNGKTCFIDQTGNILKTEEGYFKYYDFENGIAAVSRADGYRFINKSGREIIDRSFDGFYFRKKGYIEVFIENGDKDEVGLLDYTGFLLIEPRKGVDIFMNKNHIMVCRFDGYTEYFNYNGSEIDGKKIDIYGYIDTFYKNRAITTINKTNEYVIIDENFNVIKNLAIFNSKDIGETYWLFNDYSHSRIIKGLCAIRQNLKWGFVDFNGYCVLQPKYDFLSPFLDVKSWRYLSRGCAIAGILVKSEIKYGAINSDFEEITEFIYDEIQWFSENVASVRIKDKWGAINSEGKLVIPITYSLVHACNNGFIKVGLGDYESLIFMGVLGFFDKNGRKITKIIYKHLGEFENGFAIVKKGEKYGIINEKGIEVVKCCYDYLSGNSKDGYMVVLDKTKFYIDSNGREFREI
jgi:hypothetical protein